ncbi:hypothetical protein [Streptomyces sp. 4N124]
MAMTQSGDTVGRTRWWVVALILGLPAALVAGVLTLLAVWVVAG